MNEQVFFSESDKTFMRRAIELAKNGTGWTNPNPLVGAVIVKDGIVIGEGYHHKYGDLHAERDALKDCQEKGNNPNGAVIYVTLEPCCHFGKQPPCTQALVQAGITKVFVGSRDPNPLVHGKGNSYLRENGITVIEDFLQEECDLLNPIFFHFISTKTPYVALKFAMTLDGKIATKTGKSKWITGEKSRHFVHQLRHQYAAILCGIGTVLADDPMLNCRLPDGSNPTRIICDSNLRIPLESQIVQTAKQIPTIVATTSSALEQNSIAADRLIQAGVELIHFEDEKVNLKELMMILGQRKIDSVLIEGGGQINFSALQQGIVNKVYAFVAPKIFGGQAKTPVIGEGISIPDEAFTFHLTSTKTSDDDILLEYEK